MSLIVEMKGVFMNKKMKKSYTALWLSFICAFVLLFPANIFAGNGDNDANADAVKGKVELTKEVKNAVKQSPGKETFSFELVPAEGHKDLATAGITVDKNTVETNGVGTFEGTLNYSVDKSKINENNGWKAFGKDKKNYLISYTLQEKNDGKEGWEYGTKKYDVVMSYYPDDNAIYTSTYLPGTDASERAKFVNTFKGTELKNKVELTKEVKQDGKQKPGKEKFMFEMVPAEGQKDLATAGITVDTNTVETDGLGTFTGDLKFTVDANKISEDNGWKAFGKNKNNYLISYTLQEKNDGKKGWEYGTKKYDVVMSYYSDEKSLYVSTYLPGTDAAERAKFVNTFKGVEMPAPQDPPKKPEMKETVKTGDSNEITALISLTILGIGALAVARRFKKNA